MSLTSKQEAIKNRRISLERLRIHNERMDRFQLERGKADKASDRRFRVMLLVYILLIVGGIVAVIMGGLNELNP